MNKYYLVLNLKAGEGVAFIDKNDAEHALTGDPSFGLGESSLADAFVDIYGDEDNITMVEIEI